MRITSRWLHAIGTTVAVLGLSAPGVAKERASLADETPEPAVMAVEAEFVEPVDAEPVDAEPVEAEPVEAERIEADAAAAEDVGEASAVSAASYLRRADVSCSPCRPKCECSTGGLEGEYAGGSGAGSESSPIGAPLLDVLGLGPDTAYAMGTSNPDRPGYIDSAVLANRLRVRFDAAYDNPFPDRAEFFYAQCGCFGGGAPGPGAGGQPPVLATSVDYQELSAYMERVWSDRFSVFFEVPVRFLNPESNNPGIVAIDNTAGMSDIQAGARYSLINDCDRFLTAQLRIYTPTGDADRGLGTGHVSIEPALLSQRLWTDRLTVFSELRLWIPISDSINPVNGEHFAGPVLRYGIGSAYRLAGCDDGCQTNRWDLVPELVGWTVIEGEKFNPAVPDTEAAGDTIINGKIGLRRTLGSHSLYGGYGFAISNEVWYENIVRAEYSFVF